MKKLLACLIFGISAFAAAQSLPPGPYGSSSGSSGGGGGTVTSVTASSPLASSGGNTPNITITSPLPVANGGTATTTAFTAGSVVFSTSSGVYFQDNSNLFYDATNHRLGLGNASPLKTLDLRNKDIAFSSSTINGVAYTWPGAQGGASTVLTNNGSGALTWGSGGSASPGGNFGAIQFNEPVGSFGGDSANLYWDTGTLHMGIGVGNPDRTLEIKPADSKALHILTNSASTIQSLFEDSGHGSFIGINGNGATPGAGVIFQDAGTSKWLIGNNNNETSDIFSVYNYTQAKEAIAANPSDNGVGIYTAAAPKANTFEVGTPTQFDDIIVNSGSSAPAIHIQVANATGVHGALEVEDTGHAVYGWFNSGGGAANAAIAVANAGTTKWLIGNNNNESTNLFSVYNAASGHEALSANSGNKGVGIYVAADAAPATDTFEIGIQTQFDSVTTGQALCLTGGNILGHCTTVVGVSGGCTCAAN